jgi:hypothetical protein
MFKGSHTQKKENNHMMAGACLCFFEKEHVLILPHYTGLFTNKTREKRKITKNFKTPVHLPRSLQRSVRRRRPSRFPIITGH